MAERKRMRNDQGQIRIAGYPCHAFITSEETLCGCKNTIRYWHMSESRRWSTRWGNPEEVTCKRCRQIMEEI